MIRFGKFRITRAERRSSSNQPDRDFSLESGERQTGNCLDEIRRDHKERYKIAIEIVRVHLQPDIPKNGLDVFCANGYGTSMLADQKNCWVLGIDASEEAIKQACENFSRANIMYCCKFFPFEIPHETFDFVTCIESLEHTKDYSKLISSLISSLREGGLLFVSTPNEEVMPFSSSEMPFHVKHFEHKELIELVTGTNETKLLTFFGQDVYEYRNSRRIGLLDESLMGLTEGRKGQFQLYVFEKSSGEYSRD